MITYEQDPDVVRWGLQLFDGDPFSNCGYGGTIIQNDVSYYDGLYFKEDHYENECSNVENDEIIAHALQEELSQLAVDEAPGLSHEVVEQLQVSVFPEEWPDQPVANYGFGIGKIQNYLSDYPSSLVGCFSLFYCAYFLYKLQGMRVARRIQMIWDLLVHVLVLMKSQTMSRIGHILWI